MTTEAAIDPHSEFLRIGTEFLYMTSSLTLTGDPEKAEQETEDFYQLMEQRKPMLAQLIKLSEAIASAGERASVKQLLEKIFAAEEKLINQAGCVMQALQGQMKNVQDTRKINVAYAHPAEFASTGYDLDTSQ